MRRRGSFYAAKAAKESQREAAEERDVELLGAVMLQSLWLDVVSHKSP